MGFTKDKGAERPGTVVLRGSLNCEHLQELKAQLLEALSRDSEVELSIEGVEHLNSSAVQLLCAACSAARARGGSLYLSGCESQRVFALARRLGLRAQGPCEPGGKCLFLLDATITLDSEAGHEG